MCDGEECHVMERACMCVYSQVGKTEVPPHTLTHTHTHTHTYTQHTNTHTCTERENNCENSCMNEVQMFWEYHIH